MINPGRTTMTDALRDMSLDLKRAQLDVRLSHLEDTLAWHYVADTRSRVKIASISTLAQCIAQANAIKASVALHFADADGDAAPELGVHDAADPETIAAADASNQATLDTLITELVLDINAHFVLLAPHVTPLGHNSALAATGSAVGDVTNTIIPAAVQAIDGTLAVSQLLLNSIQTAWYWHSFRGPLARDDDNLQVYPS